VSCNTGGFISPIVEYEHTAGRCSITGGYVYRGSARTLPAGTYVYGDFCTGEIFWLDATGQRLLLDTGLTIASFGEDEARELYVVDLGGAVYRLVNLNPPPATIAATFESPGNGENVSGIALVRGWAFATQTNTRIESVKLFIDGGFAEEIPCCSERADVQAAFSEFPAANTLNSGWGVLINWGRFDAGLHTIRVRVKSTAGDVFWSEIRTMTVVKVGDSEFLDLFDQANATTHIEGEEIVISGARVRDKASGQIKTVTVRLRWSQSSQAFGVVASQ
jgi:hypothetical protein